MASFESNFLRSTPGLEYEATRPQNIRRAVQPQVPEFNDQNYPAAMPSTTKQYTRPNQYQNQFQQSVENAQGSMSPGKPVDYNSVENQLRRMQSDKPITQSADFRELSSRMPGTTDKWTRDNELRNARVGGNASYTRTPGGHVIWGDGNAAEAALRAQYAAEDMRAQQGLMDAYSGAKEAILERQRMQNAADVAELGQRATLAQQGLTATGYGYNTDATNAVQRQRDFADLYSKNPATATMVYPEFGSRMRQASGQAPGQAPIMGSGKESWSQLQSDNSEYSANRRAAVKAELSKLQVPSAIEDIVLDRAGEDLSAPNLKKVFLETVMGSEAQPQGAIFKRNVGTPNVTGVPEQQSQLQKWYNDHAYMLAAAEAGVSPMLMPMAMKHALDRFKAGRQPGSNDIVVSTDMGNQIIPDALNNDMLSRWYSEQQKQRLGR